MPKTITTFPTTTIPAPAPVDPVQESRARIQTQRAEAPFVQQVRQQMVLLDDEITRLETQIETLTQQYNDRCSQRQHLTAYLSVAAQEKA